MLSSVVNSRPKPREAIGCYAHSSLLLHATVSPSTAVLMDLPAKCCKQKTYGIANSFRCNTYKKQGGGAPSPLGFDAPPFSRSISSARPPVIFPPVAALSPGCYDLVFHDPR
jgi:hypothetical protein